MGAKGKNSQDTENTVIDKRLIQAQKPRNYADVDITDDFKKQCVKYNLTL